MLPPPPGRRETVFNLVGPLSGLSRLAHAAGGRSRVSWVRFRHGLPRAAPSPWGHSGIFKVLARWGSIRCIAERAASRTAQLLFLSSGITPAASS